MALVRFKRSGNTSVVKIKALKAIPDPSKQNITGEIRLASGTQIDQVAAAIYGPGNEGSWPRVANKNINRLVAWNLDTRYIPTLDI